MAVLTFLSGASLSGSINLKDVTSKSGDLVRLFGLDIPSPYTAANLVVYQKHSDGEYKPVKDETGADLTITATAGATIRFSNPAQFASLDDIKLRSGTVAVPVAQLQDTPVTLILRAI